jgi:hypothetical protein
MRPRGHGRRQRERWALRRPHCPPQDSRRTRPLPPSPPGRGPASSRRRAQDHRASPVPLSRFGPCGGEPTRPSLGRKKSGPLTRARFLGRYLALTYGDVVAARTRHDQPSRRPPRLGWGWFPLPRGPTRSTRPPGSLCAKLTIIAISFVKGRSWVASRSAARGVEVGNTHSSSASRTRSCAARTQHLHPCQWFSHARGLLSRSRARR